MNNKFVIMATTGEFSDRDEWPVLIVATEQRAQEIVLEYTEKANVLKAQYRLGGEKEDNDQGEELDWLCNSYGKPYVFSTAFYCFDMRFSYFKVREE